MKNIALIISCEHAVNTVPKDYQPYFETCRSLLYTHRGIDLGALTVAEHIQSVFECHLVQAQVTRMLIDCNRSLTHPRCFSEISTLFSDAQKTELIEQFYLPFREAVEHCIEQYIDQGQQVLHLSVHSFTPIWMDTIRDADIGLLYDPSREQEKKLAKQWRLQLKQDSSTFRIRLN